MSTRNYWKRMSRQRLSRRTLLRASARAGVGATGLALVGCGDDDDDAQQAVVQAQPQEQQEQPQPAEQPQQQQQQQQAMQQEQAEQQAEQQAQQVEQQEQQAEQGTVEAIEREEAEQDVEAAEPEVDLDAHVRVAIGRYTAGLDPQRSGSQTNYVNGACTFDSGMSNHPETAALEPNLVQLPEIVDPTNVIFHVTPGVMFHDGSPYTAHDLAFNFERVSSAAEYHQGGETSDHPNEWASARQAFGTDNFASYSVIDDLTMAVETPAPNASLAGSIMSGAVRHVSKNFVEEHGDAYVDAVFAMGTGPFRFVDSDPDVGANWTRNDDYHKPRDGLTNPRLPWYKDFEVQIRPEPLAQIAGIEAGEIDAIYNLPTDVVEPYRDNPNFKVLYQPSGQPTHYIMFNTHDSVAEVDGVPNPFLDIRVREAANLAINRQEIIDGLLTGSEGPAFGPYRGTIGYPGEALESRYHGYDPERAKALLEEAGYPDGLDVDLHIVTDFQPIVPIMALPVQEYLEAVGIRTTIKEYLSSEYFRTVRTFELPGMFWFFTNTIAEPETVIGSGVTESGFYAVSVYPETEIEELYQAQNQALDPAERARLLAELYITFYDNYSWLFLTEVSAATMTAANVNWPVGSAELRGEGTLSAIQKLKDA